MEKKMQIMYWVIEVNLVFWLAVLGFVVNKEIIGYPRGTIILGVIFSALLQLWAYHDLVNEHKKTK